jgi:hypothetical protein
VAGGQPSGAAPAFTISTIETRVGGGWPSLGRGTDIRHLHDSNPRGCRTFSVVCTEKVRVGVSGLCVLVFLIVCVVFLDCVYFVFDLRRHPERACFSATRDLLLFFFLADA